MSVALSPVQMRAVYNYLSARNLITPESQREALRVLKKQGDLWEVYQELFRKYPLQPDEMYKNEMLDKFLLHFGDSLDLEKSRKVMEHMGGGDAWRAFLAVAPIDGYVVSSMVAGWVFRTLALIKGADSEDVLIDGHAVLYPKSLAKENGYDKRQCAYAVYMRRFSDVFGGKNS